MNRGEHLKGVVPPLLGAAALIAVSVSAIAPASAQPQEAGTVRLAQLPHNALADQLTGRLGGRQAGTYLDGAGNLVVNVTSEAAAQQVRASGAKARVVKHGIAPLTASMTKLDRLAGTDGTVGLAWGVDVISNAVVISVPQGDNDAATKAFVKRARALGDTVQIKRVAAAPRLTLGPGEAILTGGSRCSVSAIGASGGTEYVVTAGHCTNIGSTWTTSGGQTVGTRQASSFPGNDYGTIRKTGSVSLTNAQLTQVGKPQAGTQIQKKGSTTGTTSGTIRGYNRTVNYQEGAVSGLIETTACVQPGDSGGSLQSGSTAIGITSGGTTGSCRSGFQSYFQPLDEALQSQGLTLKR
ncbi:MULTISPECIES: S1 family peptidase [Actinomadura]|uniref:S1 family peptidase n=1 Tax=Actinomadura litoris TaxID=2678616 RepID=A0A7K1KUI6_9ACTN|nr:MULTISPECIES: S1 family peptidase [Actinomadura]MBT2207350.1 alpha-lytic protease prodomain-containing protein [Actinomadura sp. NEAU-AAG7]MUN35841.1 S1 family peptidase [Actinomadura litoris]